MWIPPLRDNPYHSRTHAADVLRNLHVIANRGGLLSAMGIGTSGATAALGMWGGKLPAAGLPQRKDPRVSDCSTVSSTMDNSYPQLPGNVVLNNVADLESQGRPSGGSHPVSLGGKHSRRLALLASELKSAAGGTRAAGLGDMPCSTGTPLLDAKDAMVVLSLYMSAVVHDYDHRGVTNAFLIQDEDPLAVGWRVDDQQVCGRWRVDDQQVCGRWRVDDQ